MLREVKVSRNTFILKNLLSVNMSKTVHILSMLEVLVHMYGIHKSVFNNSKQKSNFLHNCLWQTNQSNFQEPVRHRCGMPDSINRLTVIRPAYSLTPRAWPIFRTDRLAEGGLLSPVTVCKYVYCSGKIIRISLCMAISSLIVHINDLCILNRL